MKNTFGLGLHLKESAGRAHEEATEMEGLKALVLVRAVAGNVHVAMEKGDSSEMVTSGQFDSVCGVHSNYREMVFFTHKALRADYIILYKQETEAAPA